MLSKRDHLLSRYILSDQRGSCKFYADQLLVINVSDTIYTVRNITITASVTINSNGTRTKGCIEFQAFIQLEQVHL